MGSLDADVAACIAAMKMAPSAERACLIDQLVTALKAAGIWPLLDIIVLPDGTPVA